VWCPQFESEETQSRRGIPGQNSNRRHHAFPTGEGECPQINAPPTRAFSNHAGSRGLRWRDPDSNRGHHDFQSCTSSGPGWRNPWKSCGFGRDAALTRCSQFADIYRRLWEWRTPQAQVGLALCGQSPGAERELGTDPLGGHTRSSEEAGTSSAATQTTACRPVRSRRRRRAGRLLRAGSVHGVPKAVTRAGSPVRR
jgi:hypothetical protein